MASEPSALDRGTSGQFVTLQGAPRSRAFHDSFVVLDRRIGLFLALPLVTIQGLAVQRIIEEIGRS